MVLQWFSRPWNLLLPGVREGIVHGLFTASRAAGAGHGGREAPAPSRRPPQRGSDRRAACGRTGAGGPLRENRDSRAPHDSVRETPIASRLPHGALQTSAHRHVAQGSATKGLQVLPQRGALGGCRRGCRRVDIAAALLLVAQTPLGSRRVSITRTADRPGGCARRSRMSSANARLPRANTAFMISRSRRERRSVSDRCRFDKPSSKQACCTKKEPPAHAGGSCSCSRVDA